jgi:hypothetical protein
MVVEGSQLEPDEQLQRAWEYHKAADELLAARMNYGLVAHSMFLVSYATIFASGDHKTHWFRFVEALISGLGLWYSLVLNGSVWALNKRIAFLKTTYLEPLDPVYASYMRVAPSSARHLRQRHLPIALALVWTALLISAILE